MSDIDAVQILIDYFQKKSWPLHLNEKKLREQSSVSREDEKSKRLIVEIERHCSILGTKYTEGIGMSAYETYFMRYAISESGDDVTKLPDRFSHVDCDGDMIAEEYTGPEKVSISVIKKGDEFTISDDVRLEEETVKNKEEAQEFGEYIAELIVESFLQNLNLYPKERLSSSERKALVDEVSNAICMNVKHLVDEAWDNPGDDDED